MHFRVLAGQHVHGGKKYNRGDVVESDLNLAKLHGREKFEPLLNAPRQRKVRAAVPAAKEAESSHPEDVTEQFPEAEELGFVVYRRDGEFHVAEADNPGLWLNPEPLTREQVPGFIEAQA